MSETARISVVIPCFNAEKYIAAAIRSVLAQDWPDLEIVVVDDGSSDGSAELVRDSFPGVRLVRQENRGVAAARNNGISCARGDWIAFLDADDIWLPGKLQAQMDLLKAIPDARMCYTAWEVWTSSDPIPELEYLDALQRQSEEVSRWSGASGWIYPQLLLDCVVWTSTVLAQRSVFLEVGYFDPALPRGEDYDLWLRASRVTQILRVAAPYALYRMHPSSITKSVPERNYRFLVVNRALSRWGYSSPNGAAAKKSAVNRALAKTWTDLACAHLRVGNSGRARQAALMALRTDPCNPVGWKTLLKILAGSLAGGG